MSVPIPDGLERLASRLALIASGDGEAEAAARAAGQLARRLGLTGGQIKAIFLAGVRSIAAHPPGTALVPHKPALTLVERSGVERPELAEREAGELRRLLDRTDDALRSSRERVEALQVENEDLRDSLDRARSATQVTRVFGAVLVVAILAGGAFAWFGAGLRLADGTTDPSPAGSSPFVRMAAVGPAGTNIYAAPDRGSEALTRLPAGSRLPVRQVLWRGLEQWVETAAAGRLGYAPATEVDLR